MFRSHCVKQLCFSLTAAHQSSDRDTNLLASKVGHVCRGHIGGPLHIYSLRAVQFHVCVCVSVPFTTSKKVR